MEVDYRLAESVLVVQGTIERVQDRYAAGRPDSGDATADVLLTVRGDEGAGQQVLDLGRGGGDNEFTVELTTDQRLVSVSYKSVGVGSRVIAGGATLVAAIGGIALRATGTGAHARLLWTDTSVLTQEDDDRAAEGTEDAARKDWGDAHRLEADHRASYATLLAGANTALLEARQQIVSGQGDVVAAAVARAYRLEGVAAAAQKEIDKVDSLYRIWREAQKDRHIEQLSFVLPVDGLAEHDQDGELPDPDKLNGVAERLWQDLGVLIEIGPADGKATIRPAPAAGPTAAGNERVRWRVPRPVRLWVWRRGASDLPTLERSFEATIVDRYSDTRVVPLDRHVFGDAGATLAFDAVGAVSKLSRNDKGALGAFVDAVGGIPADIVSGLESASKITSSLTTLATADSQRRLDALKREVEAKEQALKLKGLDATDEDFAELKRLEQQVLIAKANKDLAPTTVSELSRVQDELALATARRDLEAITRQRALDGELAAAQAEIARLTTQLQLAQARRPPKG